MSSELVTCEVAEGIHVLSLNRPDKLNALNFEMFRQFDRHLTEGLNDAACVLLRANGRSFCAGHDLDDLAANESYEAERFASAVVEKIATLPMPVIAAVQGHCMTGGLELVLAADVIIAAEGAHFADTHSKWDLVPIWGLTQRLPRRIGSYKAMELMFTGRKCGGAEAAEIGLANICVPDDELDARAREFCAGILNNSARSNRAIKKLLLDTDGMPLKQGLAWELHYSEGHGPEFLDRLASMRK